jgi:hypothetical protein
VLVAYTALGVGYAIRTPLWQNPDEPAHFNYVAHVARTGTLPELKQGDWDSALLSRLQNGRLDPSEIPAIRYESWQPPLYYLLAVPVYLFGPADDAAVVLRLRFFGVLLGGLTLIVSYRTAYHLLPQALALAVPLTMAGIPMFTAISASVSADPLANLLAATLLLALLRRVNWRLLGALLGLALVTKLALAVFIPLVLWRAWRSLAAAAVITLLWLAHQMATYGWIDPLALARHAEVVADQQRFTGVSADYAREFVTVTFHSFWAQFGWMAIPAPDRLYWLWGVLMLLAGAGLILHPPNLRDPAWRFVVLTLGLAVVAYVGYNLSFTQFQGRYLFVALVPICLLLVRGWSALLPARWSSVAVWSGGALLVAVNAYALERVLVPGFAPVS